MMSESCSVARRNLDLWVVLILAAVGLGAQWLPLPVPVRLIGGLALVVLCPGYALTAALFPGRTPGWPERVVFSLGLSLAVAILGAVVFNTTIWGLQIGVWAGLFAGVTLCASLVAVWRRSKNAEETGPTATHQRRLSWAPWVLLAVAGSLTVGALTLGHTPSAPNAVVGYTLLWITPAGDANAPAVRLGLSSSEFATTHYRLKVTFDSRLFLDVTDITLAPGEKMERVIPLPAGQPVQVVEAVLYRQDDPGTVYRRVTLLRTPPTG